MDFQPTEDQKALREGIRSFVEGQVPNERFAELEARYRAIEAANADHLERLGSAEEAASDEVLDDDLREQLKALGYID